VKYNIVAYDFGVKYNILRSMRQQGFDITVVNSRTSAEEVLALNPDGIFLSNGPGDPAALDYIHAEVKKLLGKKPIFGICLGHQILTLALGGRTVKMKFGHHGANHPVRDLFSHKTFVTSQNHGYMSEASSLPETVSPWFINANDQSIEGLWHKEKPIASVQFHPEASPGPHDGSWIFDRFIRVAQGERS
jgi:carbamoyl-phosphate synthase small subunit